METVFENLGSSMSVEDVRSPLSRRCVACRAPPRGVNTRHEQLSAATRPLPGGACDTVHGCRPGRDGGLARVPASDGAPITGDAPPILRGRGEHVLLCLARRRTRDRAHTPRSWLRPPPRRGVFREALSQCCRWYLTRSGGITLAAEADRRLSLSRGGWQVFEGQAEVDLAMDLFRGVSITDAREGGGPPEIPVDEIRRLMTTAGSEPLSEEELNELLRLADPEGLGMVPLDRWT
eukprot:2172929-Prymnesium_polylepis.1